MEYYVLNKYGTYFVVTVRPQRPIFSELRCQIGTSNFGLRKYIYLSNKCVKPLHEIILRGFHFSNRGDDETATYV